MRLGDWLEERTGLRSAWARALDEAVPGGASWAYVFGSVLVFLLVVQAVTGTILALYYTPSIDDAWGSVVYLQDQVAGGWFVRGLHSHGASAAVVVAGLHMLQVALWGAYRRPREMNWLVGVVLLGLLFAFALTGYLLPWDQKGYWATKVATGIAGQTPVLGAWLQRLLQGGNEYGQLTLNRFFVLHVLVLPALVALVTAWHVKLFRRHGVTTRWGRRADDLAARTQPFWPDQLLRDLVACAVVSAGIAGWVFASQGAALSAPADPAGGFDARPEWYFLPLFQLLKVAGPFEKVVALGAPLVALVALCVVPFLDRDPNRRPRHLPRFVVGTLLGAAVLLGAMAVRDDASDPELQKRIAEADRLALRARGLARQGIPPGGGLMVWENDPLVRAQRVFTAECAGCHVGAKRKGPELVAGYGNRAWIRAYLLDPQGARFFGPTKGLKRMKPVKLAGADLDAIVEMVYAESGAKDAAPDLVTRGRQLFDEGTCSDCHSRDGTTADDVGPNLGGRGTKAWFAGLIADPSAGVYFGDHNEMPGFARELSEADRAALAAWLVALRDAD